MVSPENMRKAYQYELVRQDLASIGLGTPEAFWARQFASQRTASAFAGPGPVQSDAFPILEYDAPLAFYLGVNASRINRFDERTWQSALALPEKRAAMLSLDDKSLGAAFENLSMNPDLQAAIAARLKRLSVERSPLPGISCVFGSPATGIEEAIPAETDEETRAAFGALQTGDANWAQHVQTIRNALLSHLSTDGVPPLQQSYGRLAAEASRVCLVHQKFDLANEMIALGCKFTPNNPEFGYLKRLLEQESGAVPKTLLSSIPR